MVRNQRWQGRLVTIRREDESLSTDGCFWWLTEWKNCPSHTIAAHVELYEQLLPTRVYTSEKRLTKYPFSWRGQSILLIILYTSCNLMSRLLLLKYSSVKPGFHMICIGLHYVADIWQHLSAVICGTRSG